MDIIELALKLLDEGHTVSIREEADGTLEVTAFYTEEPTKPKKPVKKKPQTPNKPTFPERGKGATMSADDLRQLKKMRTRGLSCPEIARTTGWSLSTVQKRLRMNR